MANPENLAAARERMIEQHLRRRGIRSTRVLDAMKRVPRELFVPAEMAAQAYADRALPIQCGQTISQPYIVALMTEALEVSGSERVLEIGAGSGYQTAILAELAGEVFSVERHEPLARQAARKLEQLGCRNVQIAVRDGARGWPEAAPFDRIIVTAAARQCPPALWEQLGEGGVLVAPLGTSENQILEAIHKVGGRPRAIPLTPCRFVPLVSDEEEDPQPAD